MKYHMKTRGRSIKGKEMASVILASTFGGVPERKPMDRMHYTLHPSPNALQETETETQLFNMVPF